MRHPCSDSSSLVPAAESRHRKAVRTAQEAGMKAVMSIKHFSAAQGLCMLSPRDASRA